MLEISALQISRLKLSALSINIKEQKGRMTVWLALSDMNAIKKAWVSCKYALLVIIVRVVQLKLSVQLGLTIQIKEWSRRLNVCRVREAFTVQRKGWVVQQILVIQAMFVFQKHKQLRLLMVLLEKYVQLVTTVKEGLKSKHRVRLENMAMPLDLYHKILANYVKRESIVRNLDWRNLHLMLIIVWDV